MVPTLTLAENLLITFGSDNWWEVLNPVPVLRQEDETQPPLSGLEWTFMVYDQTKENP